MLLRSAFMHASRAPAGTPWQAASGLGGAKVTGGLSAIGVGGLPGVGGFPANGIAPPVCSAGGGPRMAAHSIPIHAPARPTTTVLQKPAFLRPGRIRPLEMWRTPSAGACTSARVAPLAAFEGKSMTLGARRCVRARFPALSETKARQAMRERTGGRRRAHGAGAPASLRPEPGAENSFGGGLFVLRCHITIREGE